jgi:hypothetical protein
MQVISTRTLTFKNPKTEASVTVRPTPRGSAAVAPDWISDDPYFEFCTGGDEPALTVLPKGTKIPKTKLIEVPVVDPNAPKKKEKQSNDGLGPVTKPFSV